MGMVLKKCKQCKNFYSLDNYYKDVTHKDGKVSTCKTCWSIRRKKQYQKNKEKAANQQREYRKKTRGKQRAYCAKRRAIKKQACPNWVDLKKIEVLYEKAKWLESLTGLKYHIDHIVPLNNENVCGLHCWENLQIIEASLNISKGNDFEL